MAYTKPTIIAQNSAAGSFAAGCPTNTRSTSGACGAVTGHRCEISV